MNPAEHIPLGHTGLTVTRLGFGGAPIAGLYAAVDEAEAYRVVRQSFDRGVRLFDTAPLYGSGLSEQRLGHVLHDLPRDQFVLSTKVGRLLRPGASPPSEQAFHGAPALHPIFDFSYDGVMRSVETSLQRLNLDRVDILHIHDPDDHYDQALSGAYRALDALRTAGRIRAVSAGMNQAEMLTRFAREGVFDCFLLAGRYTLLDQTGLQELLPVCLEKNIAVIVGGIYNSGILIDPREGALFDYEPADRVWIEKARALQAVCARHGVPLPAAAIQFPLAHPAVASVLIGMRSVAELEDNLRLCQFPIPDDLWLDLRRRNLIPDNAPTPNHSTQE